MIQQPLDDGSLYEEDRDETMQNTPPGGHCNKTEDLNRKQSPRNMIDITVAPLGHANALMWPVAASMAASMPL